MSLIKKSACVLFCLIFAAVLFPIKASAITIDGKIENLEWKNVERVTLFKNNSNTNCDIDFAIMRVFVDGKNNAVFLAVQVTQKTAGALQPDNKLAGIKLSTSFGESIFYLIDDTHTFDSATYSVSQKMVVGTNNDLSIEMRIGYLFGVPANPLAGLQLIDSYGQYSNYYSFPVVETTPATTVATTNPVTTTPTTTKPSTAKSTTKPSTTVVEQTAQTGKKPAVTTTAKNIIIKTNGAAGVEHILSEDAKTDESTSRQIASTDRGAEENTTACNSESQEKSTETTSNKKIVAVAAAVLLVALAVYLCIAAGKPKQEPKQPGNAQPNHGEKTDENEFDDDF